MNQAGDETVQDVQQTTCCVVGAGPAGAVLALLLARAGVPVTLLESHLDFDRDFRGNTIPPSTLEILDQIGRADKLLKIPHGKLRKVTSHPPQGPIHLVDMSLARTLFPSVAVMPRVRFLEFITTEASHY